MYVLLGMSLVYRKNATGKEWLEGLSYMEKARKIANEQGGRRDVPEENYTVDFYSIRKNLCRGAQILLEDNHCAPGESRFKWQ